MATIIEVNGHAPDIDADAFVAETAVIAGDVRLAAGVSVWFGCVLRSEQATTAIGEDTNIQDLTVIHTDPWAPVSIGSRVTIGHRCVMHGCTIEDDALIGMGAVVLNEAVVGRGAVVAAGAVVSSGTQIPPLTVYAGIPARELTRATVPGIPRPNVESYAKLAHIYRSEK